MGFSSAAVQTWVIFFGGAGPGSARDVLLAQQAAYASGEKFHSVTFFRPAAAATTQLCAEVSRPECLPPDSLLRPRPNDILVFCGLQSDGSLPVEACYC